MRVGHLSLFGSAVITGLLVGACTETSFTTHNADASTSSADADTSTCAEDTLRCEGDTLYVCRSKQWSQKEVCKNGRICSEQAGCVECDPSLPRTCVGNEVHVCDASGVIGALVDKCLTMPCSNGACGSSGCSSGTSLIYVVDDKNQFLSFDPANNANTLTPIGTLKCPAGAGWPGTMLSGPFSMSVDRTGRAWVLYQSGEIFWVDIKTAACTPTSFVKGSKGYQLFGMGFVADAVGSTKEKLYIFGGSVLDLKSGNLATIDPTTLDITTIGPLTMGEEPPELTGTGNATLFAYFPGVLNTTVQEIDKTSGKSLHTWPLPSQLGIVRGYAFAHWGGKFYIFLTINQIIADRSMVLRLDPATGKVDTILDNLPYVIVGAGVSTCAPVID